MRLWIGERLEVNWRQAGEGGNSHVGGYCCDTSRLERSYPFPTSWIGVLTKLASRKRRSKATAVLSTFRKSLRNKAPPPLDSFAPKSPKPSIDTRSLWRVSVRSVLVREAYRATTSVMHTLFFMERVRREKSITKVFFFCNTYAILRFPRIDPQ